MAKNDAGKPALSIVRQQLDNAQPAPKVGKNKAAGKDQDEQSTLPLLPAGCPVEPLGVNGQTHYYLDQHRQLIPLGPDKHGKGHILALFGRKAGLCEEFWPRYSDKKDPETGLPRVTGWRPEEATKALMLACSNRGIFDPQGKVRGTGAHRGIDGELMLHCGSAIYRTAPVAKYEDPGLLDGFVYPAGPSRPRPHEERQSGAAAETILTHLRAWQWFRPLVDPMLLLGWVGCAMVGGALHWRPHAWVTGSTATGKSTLQHLLRGLFGDGALTTGDATEASLRQLLKQQTLPVFFDELEPDDGGDNRKNLAVIKLARLASSGEQALRGGQNHEGHEFTIRSCFLFSSILMPPMGTQDRNRLAILELDRIPPGNAAPVIDLAQIRELGRQLRRRLVDQWERLEDVLSRYKTALAAVGHSGRSGDQFGTLLAVADVMLYDVTDKEIILEWAERLRANVLAESETNLSDEQEIVQFLGTSMIAQRGGEEPQPVVRHVREAIDPQALFDGTNNKAADRLENNGLRVGQLTEAGGLERPKQGTPTEQLFLAVANSHTALEKLFGDRRWSGGGWQQSFARVEGARRRVKVRFAGARAQWATLIPLSAVLDLDYGAVP